MALNTITAREPRTCATTNRWVRINPLEFGGTGEIMTITIARARTGARRQEIIDA